VVELQVALESRLRGQRRRVDGLDRREVGLVVFDVPEDPLPRGIREAIVPGVDPQVRRPGRLLLDDAPEARLDEVVEAVVERPRLNGCRRPGELDAPERSVRGRLRRAQAAAPARRPAGGLSVGGAVSARASRNATIAVSMSAGSMPWCVTARTWSCG
jgi:hypothetical protein